MILETILNIAYILFAIYVVAVAVFIISENRTPQSTFAWLLFAVTGAEVAAPYVKDTENPQKDFPDVSGALYHARNGDVCLILFVSLVDLKFKR